MSWEKRAACRGITDNPAFTENAGSRTASHSAEWKAKVAAAKTICAQCPVTAECLQYAYDTKSEAGIYGGLTVRERKTIRARRASGS